MISADNLRRKFLIFLCELGSARFAEKNKEVPTRKFHMNKEKAHVAK